MRLLGVLALLGLVLAVFSLEDEQGFTGGQKQQDFSAFGGDQQGRQQRDTKGSGSSLAGGQQQQSRQEREPDLSLEAPEL